MKCGQPGGTGWLPCRPPPGADGPTDRVQTDRRNSGGRGPGRCPPMKDPDWEADLARYPRRPWFKRAVDLGHRRLSLRPADRASTTGPLADGPGPVLLAGLPVHGDAHRDQHPQDGPGRPRPEDLALRQHLRQCRQRDRGQLHPPPGGDDRQPRGRRPVAGPGRRRRPRGVCSDIGRGPDRPGGEGRGDERGPHRAASRREALRPGRRRAGPDWSSGAKPRPIATNQGVDKPPERKPR